MMDTGNGLASGNLFEKPVAQATTVEDPSWGGYMDAGDWDRRIQQLDIAHGLLELFELLPAAFEAVELSIPVQRRDNNLPDILDEALFGLDYFRLMMQQPSGAARGGQESAEHPRRCRRRCGPRP